MERPQYVIVRPLKSVGVAYVLLILLGQLGMHRFYCERVGSGFTQLLLCVLGYCTLPIGIGLLLLLVLWGWLVVDLFLTVDLVRAVNAGIHRVS